MARLREWMRHHGTEGLASVEIRSDGTRSVFAFQAARRGAYLEPQRVADLGDVALDGRTVSGDPTLWLQVGDLSLRASPNAFYQVNLEVNQALVAHLRDVVAGLAPERILDLYAGIGNLALALAADGPPVVAVEMEGQATKDLRVSAQRAGLLERVRIVTSRVERFDPAQEPFDVAVLDPPRAGAPGVLERVVHNRPRAIVYVACNAPVAARDCREALAAGYRLTALRCFEMFPDTHHIEAVALLERQ
jgi:23S rRNA (uracil1939-C5)-methyltransferase